MARDGGWWVLGVRDGGTAACLSGVEMSTSHTGAETLAALRRTGAAVTLVAELADFDTVDDIPVVGRVCAPGSRFSHAARGSDMHGQLYERALDGERCWIRRDDGSLRHLPVYSWLGGARGDRRFDEVIVNLCSGPTLDLACGPGRLVAGLVRRGLPALGVDLSHTAIELARGNGAPVLCRDLFEPLPEPVAGTTCCWPTEMSGWAVIRGGCCSAPVSCFGGAAAALSNSTW